MTASEENGNILVVLSADEALVLCEWLYRLNELPKPELFQDQAEERVLFDLEAVLESNVPAILDSSYLEILSQARERVRDSDE